MTDDERRAWLAGLRPYDRAAIRTGSGRYLRGCHLLERRDTAIWYPEDPIWDITLDANGYGTEERYFFVHESELEPLPYPGMTGTMIVEPEPKRRRRRQKAKAAIV